jgi:hypothetical protein
MTQRNWSVYSRTARLNLEGMEPRDCPACVVYQAGGAVHVVGDDAANTVVISETGTHPPFISGRLTITADGMSTFFPAASVRRIVVQTRGGDDVVTFTSSAAAGNDGISSLSLNLGTGNDVADLTVSRNTLAPPDFVGTWNLTVSGSTGDDAVVMRFGRIDYHAIRIQANLGDGNDTFAALFGGPIAEANGKRALIRLSVQGGAGDDSMDLEALTQAELADLAAVFQGGSGDDDLTMAVGFASDTNCRVRLRVLAGEGNDLVSVYLANSRPPGELSNAVVICGGSGDDDLSYDGVPGIDYGPSIDGGAGFDVCWLGSLFAQPQNCDMVIS